MKLTKKQKSRVIRLLKREHLKNVTFLEEVEAEPRNERVRNYAEAERNEIAKIIKIISGK